ncbi:hypothetical protein, partial [Janthinobacterium sp.]|uniref:hypothetical protein n=1 Tax=Janthinobacterium sp. TaxID=1871054 RepID=UPI00293D39A5
VPGYALHGFPFFIWYTYPQLLLKNAASRPGSNLDRRGGSILDRRQHVMKEANPQQSFDELYVLREPGLDVY